MKTKFIYFLNLTNKSSEIDNKLHLFSFKICVVCSVLKVPSVKGKTNTSIDTLISVLTIQIKTIETLMGLVWSWFAFHLTQTFKAKSRVLECCSINGCLTNQFHRSTLLLSIQLFCFVIQLFKTIAEFALMQMLCKRKHYLVNKLSRKTSLRA